MKEQVQTQLQQRIQALYRYTNALENDDQDTIAEVLSEAQQDQVLERMILEVNEVYQIEDRAVAHPDDVASAQDMLMELFPESSIDQPEEESAPAQPLQASSSQPSSLRYLPQRKWYRTRRSWLLGAVAAILIVLIIAPGSGALASQFLSLFRVQQFQPVQTTIQRPDELVDTLNSTLRDFGTLYANNNNPNSTSSNTSLGQTSSARASNSNTNGANNDSNPNSSSPDTLLGPTSNTSLANVEKLTNFHVLLPSYLPDGTGHVAQYTVNNSEEASFVFSSEKARAYLAATGQSNITIPAQLDGATFTVSVNPGVLITYNASCSAQTPAGQQQCTNGKTTFEIAELPSPTIKADGRASFSDLRNFLLSLPKLSSDTRNLLEHTNVNSGVIPVPIPTEVSSQQTIVMGSPAVVLNYSKYGLVFWQSNGIVYLIGSIGATPSQLLSAARSLQ
jgi:hypothetical protein